MKLKTKVNKCALCGDTAQDDPKIHDSYYGHQYLCDNGCWDAYDGYYCDRCEILHDWDTPKTELSFNDYCAASDPS